MKLTFPTINIIKMDIKNGPIRKYSTLKTLKLNKKLMIQAIMIKINSLHCKNK